MRLDRRSTLKAAAAIVLGSASARLAGAEGGRDWRAKIDEVGTAAIKAGSTAGLAIAVVRNGRTEYARGFGFANLETGTSATEHSIFRIASVTKTFTAAAIMRLVDQGKLSLEHRLGRFYPGIPGASNVSMYHLLSHTSGIHDYVNGGLPAESVGWKTPDEFARGVARMKPLHDFESGARFSYSNSGYILLGGVIEKASGKSYDDFLAESIFKPLGMVRTAVDHLEEVVPGRADGYATDGSSFRHPAHSGLPHAAGAVRSTASDLALWSAAFFAGRVVSPNSVRLMTTPALTRSGAKVGEARWWPDGFSPGNPPAFARDNNYGLGWDLTTFHGRPTAGHSGGISGFNSMLLRYLDEDLSVVLLANTENGIIAPWMKLIEWAGQRS